MGNSPSQPARRRRITIPNHAKRTTVEYVLKKGRTGDVILFSGIGEDSDMVRFFGRETMWSHMGMIVVDDHGQKFLFESNKGTYPFDCYSNTAKDGVRCSDLVEKLTHYNGNFLAYRRLKIPKKIRASARWNNELCDFIQEAGPLPYTQSLEELFLSIDQNNMDLYETGDYFCVQLIAEMYIRWGFFSGERHADNYRLKDFSTYEPEGYLDWTRDDVGLEQEMFF